MMHDRDCCYTIAGHAGYTCAAFRMTKELRKPPTALRAVMEDDKFLRESTVEFGDRVRVRYYAEDMEFVGYVARMDTHGVLLGHGKVRPYIVTNPASFGYVPFNMTIVEKAKPPLPPEPPIGSVVLGANGIPWSRTDIGGMWQSAIGWDYQWKMLVEAHGPVRLMKPEPVK